MNFKSLLAATAIAATAFIGGGAAQASTCMEFGPGSLCNTHEYNNRYGQVYAVGYYNGRGSAPAEKVQMKVVCDGRNLVDWSGTKWNLNERQVRWIAEEFCALPNG